MVEQGIIDSDNWNAADDSRNMEYVPQDLSRTNVFTAEKLAQIAQIIQEQTQVVNNGNLVRGNAHAASARVEEYFLVSVNSCQQLKSYGYAANYSHFTIAYNKKLL